MLPFRLRNAVLAVTMSSDFSGNSFVVSEFLTTCNVRKLRGSSSRVLCKSVNHLMAFVRAASSRKSVTNLAARRPAQEQTLHTFPSWIGLGSAFGRPLQQSLSVTPRANGFRVGEREHEPVGHLTAIEASSPGVRRLGWTPRTQPSARTVRNPGSLIRDTTATTCSSRPVSPSAVSGSAPRSGTVRGCHPASGSSTSVAAPALSRWP